MSEPPKPPRPPPGALTRSTVGGFAWLFSGQSGQMILQIVVLGILARLLVPEDFGEVTIVMVLLGFATIVAQLGIGPAVVQRSDLEPRHERAAFTMLLLLGIALAALTWMLAPVAVALFRGRVEIFRAMSVMFVFQNVAVVAGALLQRDLRFRRLASIEVTAFALGYGAVSLALAFAGFGVWALVAGNLSRTALASILTLLARPHAKGLGFDPRAAGDLLFFGGGFTLARFFNALALQGDNLMVSRLLGASALGLYSRAYQLMTLPATMIGTVLDTVLFPALARVQGNDPLLRKVFTQGTTAVALLTLPVGALLYVLAPEIVLVLLGSRWVAATVPLQIFALGTFFRTSYKLSDSLARAKGAVYRRAWRQAIYAGSIVIGSLLGANWGIAGVAWAVLIGLGLNFVLMAQLSFDLTGLRWGPFLINHLPAVGLALVVLGEGWLVTDLLRSLLPPLGVLLITPAVIVATALILIRILPGIFLGEVGRQTVDLLSQSLPRPLRGRKVF